MILLDDKQTNFPEKITGIPENYNFEIPKILKTIQKTKAKKITLQFPDGLLAYAPLIIDTIQMTFPGVDCVILNDVVYGACCVDDQSLNSDLLIHFGHSCLIPITEMETRTLYIFVEIKIDLSHLHEMVLTNFSDNIAIIGTIQFNSSVNKLKQLLMKTMNNENSCTCNKSDNNNKDINCNNEDMNYYNNNENANFNKSHNHNKDINCNKSHIHNKDINCIISDNHKEDFNCESTHDSNNNNTDIKYNNNCCKCRERKVLVPQVKPLSPGEVLGCTSPIITGTKDVLYIGDGRFHLESAMIRNPNLNFFKYCPFTKKLSREFYNFEKMKKIRELEIKKAFEGKSFGVILGSLGRQGNRKIFNNIVKRIQRLGNYKVYKIVVDEINQKILDNFSFIDAFVQVSCPRLSIDWGSNYRKPLLSPFELFYENEYQMDYYSNEGSAPWKNYNNDYE